MILNFISNKYLFRDEKDNKLEIEMLYNYGSVIMNFSLNGEHIYYYVVPKKSLDIKEDLEIVDEAVQALKTDHQRWLEKNAKLVRKNYDKFELLERSSLYEAINDENENERKIIMGIIEDNKDNFTITLRDNVNGISMRTHVIAESKEEILEIMENLTDLIYKLLLPFKNDNEQLRIAHFNEYILGES